MKVDVVWRRHSAAKLAACWLVLVPCVLWAGARAASPLGPSDRPEAYFNGSSYIRLSRPISLKQLVGLSFRTCVGGELFSQRFEGYTLRVSALFEQVVVQWARPNQPQQEAGLAKETLDNRWHWVALRYRPNPPSLLLEVDKDTQVISNVTWNPELLSPGALESGGAVLVVGGVFSGCILEGPQLEFHAASSQIRNVHFGHCPLTTDDCIDRKDVLRIPPKDHCYNEPCMRHGTCISRQDKYECHCTARYTGNNCEVDVGEPCASAPCRHGAPCVEDARGDYTCHCPPNYHGTYCEQEVSLDPQCVAGPCLNNGSCSVPAGAEEYVCACLPGYSGRNCEVDVDECASAVDACLNGGLCVDAVNNYTCDCSGTGYTGARCEVNVNECVEESNMCGHGVCYDTYGGYVCACHPGYTGETCHTMSACASGPCGAGGACVEESGGAGFRCVCARGWAPPLCDAPLPPHTTTTTPTLVTTTIIAPTTINLCADVVCPPKSHCTPNQMVVTGVIAKQVSCVCDNGYYGAPGPSPNCTNLESTCEVGVCLNGATCTLGADHFNCTCAPGYKGAYCEQAAGAGAGKALSDLKVAERCAAGPCGHAHSCQDLATGFRCECEAGWSGLRCDVAAAGAGPGSGADDTCQVRGCENGGTCRVTGECECRGGWGGERCEVPGATQGAMSEAEAECRAWCVPHSECVELGGAWRCAPAAPDSACASAPCNNGTCLALDNGLFQCHCPPGYKGQLCDVDVDECAIKPKICHHGVCVNVPGSYECYCRPGYTGDSCEQDIDECLSSPCKNGGTCQNLENNYDCTCMEGFEGKDCSININECENNPCAAGSTCVDGIASYSCVCQDGLTGPNCETDIDDCQSQPCLHGGRCLDGLNTYTCECAGTGYSGEDCALNIDECAPQPCQHGGTCIDDINDYRCSCHLAYTGKNCEIDISECESEPCKYGGVCLERSNASLYMPEDGATVLVGHQPQMVLPRFFYQPFTYENAAGFECVCVLGTNGSRCETNIDECVMATCQFGKCVDGIGEYSCDCLPGYEGVHCENEIDECARYAPCAHGTCVDGRATYECVCVAGWGGRNCSVVLEGCSGAPCHHDGTCYPWLRDETDHRFNCSCTPGHYGTTCDKITTMSLEKSSYAEVNTSREVGYDISFRFKTTLGNGLLAMGRGLTYFFLELSNGRLNLHSSLLNKWEGVFIGSNLNDSNWQKVFVTINSSHLVLAANEEQTIYPISQNEAYNSSVTSFPSTRLGTAGSSYATLTHGPNFFVGCFQDVVVNGQWVLPEDSNATDTETTTEATLPPGEEEGEDSEEGSGGARAVLRGVRASCPRRAQCAPNPCRSGGACLDAWTSFVCTCPRPHLGDTCQYNYTAATFGHESASRQSVVRVAVSESARRAVRAALDISMFIRTRKPTGQIFYLGSIPRYGATDETQVGASLEGGELLVHLRFNQTPENYTVGGTRLDNGYLHLIEVVRNSTLVQVKLNGTEYFRKSISAAKQIDAQVLYLGGPPPVPQPPPADPNAPFAAALSAPAPLPTAPATSAPSSAPDTPTNDAGDAAYFKGIIQDVQISNGVNMTIVEFFPLHVEGLQLPPPFGEVTLDPAGVLPGVVSDDVCAQAPCQHDATCTNTWNDYVCHCPRGYKGKQCSEVEFCQLQGCPLNSHCRNLDAGYECVSNATFDGVNTTLTYRLRQPARAPPVPLASNDHHELPDTLTITYRSKTGGTLFHAENVGVSSGVGGGAWFTVGVYKEQVAVQWRLGDAPLPTLKRLRAAHSHQQWTTIRFTFTADTIRGMFIEPPGAEDVSVSAPIDTPSWQALVTEGRIHLGGLGHAPTHTLTTSTQTYAPLTESATDPNVWEYSEGEEVTGDNMAGEYFKGCMGAVHVGGLLLPFFTEEQLFVGNTAALLAAQPHYALQSGRPYGASTGVGCVLCLESECAHGGHCEDVRSSYTCTCPPGYTGDYCQVDVDECETHDCKNGATCVDGVADYTCVCPIGFTGRFCEVDIDECSSSPCAHGGTCTDGAGTYTCVCAAAWRGPTCAAPRDRTCAHQPCARGARTCLDVTPDPPTGNNFTCECLDGFEGVYCESAFCERTPCVHGNCVADNKTATCVCSPGYSGALCESERDECAEAAVGGAPACAHNGRCVDARGHYTCDCQGTGWTGARCEEDVDECLSGLVSCGPGECLNLNGSYTCVCAGGFCGHECSLLDPCYGGPNRTGPCEHGARCEQRCAAHTDYICHCVDGWGGKNCSQQVVAAGSEGSSDSSSTVLIAVGAALVALALAGAALGGLGAQARRKRATRGTYSPSGQEYCNPRAEKVPHALKPPPEERLI